MGPAEWQSSALVISPEYVTIMTVDKIHFSFAFKIGTIVGIIRYLHNVFWRPERFVWKIHVYAGVIIRKDIV